MGHEKKIPAQFPRAVTSGSVASGHRPTDLQKPRQYPYLPPSMPLPVSEDTKRQGNVFAGAMLSFLAVDCSHVVV